MKNGKLLIFVITLLAIQEVAFAELALRHFKPNIQRSINRFTFGQPEISKLGPDEKTIAAFGGKKGRCLIFS